MDPLSSALEGVLARYAKVLRSVAFRHGVPAEDVEEVVQEVRVRLWRARPVSETIAALGVSYVYRTAVSAALDVVRRRRNEAAPEPDDKQEPATSAASGPEQVLARSEVASAVADVVCALPEARRVAVRLYLVGYTRDEIADMVGWSQAKARNLIYRGLADVRAELARRGIGPEDLS
jgi:RNA polymerase sigma factor (sigma-70 family)